MSASTILSALGMAAGKVIVKKATESLLDNKDNIYTYLQSNFTKIRNEDVRFSISYLIRIKIPDSSKYLLVRGHRIPDQFQPVGGVYKKYNGFSEFEKWGFKDDSSVKGIKSDEISKNDLRFRVKGKFALDVIKWFESEENREINHFREFKEELIDDHGFNQEIFFNLDLRKVQKVMKVFNYSTFHSCYEVLIYDIVELIPTPEQGEELKKLLNKPRSRENDLIVVDISEIEQLRVMENEEQIAKIGEHTKFLINEK